MANHDHPQPVADTQHQKTIFLFRMVWVKEADGMLIQENRLGLVKRNAVLTHVRPAFRFIPFEPHLIHMYNVHFVRLANKRKLCNVLFLIISPSVFLFLVRTSNAPGSR